MNGGSIRGNYLLEELGKTNDVDLVAPYCGKKFPGRANTFYVGAVDRFSPNKEWDYLRMGLESLKLYGKLAGDYDVVYCFGVAGVLLAEKFAGKTKLVLDFYEEDFPELRKTSGLFAKLVSKAGSWRQRRVMGKADEIILLSPEMQDYVMGLTGVETVTVLDAGDKRFFNDKVRRAHDKFTVVFHGGIDRRDNVLTLLKAVEKLLDERSLRVVIVGEGGALRKCRAYVKGRERLESACEFTGWVDYEKMPDVLGRADLAVVPATREPINELVVPRKIYEYMNCGIPVIVTRLAALARFFSGGEVFFVDEPTPDAIAERILYCMDNPGELSEKSRLLVSKSLETDFEVECAKIIRILTGT